MFRILQTFSAKYLLESFLMFSCVFRFSKASFLCPDIFIHGILKFRRHLDTGNFVISHVKLQINDDISRQN